MSFDNLKITFHLDGDGILYDMFNPIHFDSIVDWAIRPMNSRAKHVRSRWDKFSGKEKDVYGSLGNFMSTYNLGIDADDDCKIPVPERTDTPYEIYLPIMSRVIKGEKVYMASALFPEGGVIETIQYFRTKYPQEYIIDCIGTANLQSGLTRDHNNPYTVTVCNKMVCYVVGKKKVIRKLLYRSHDKCGNILPEKKLKVEALDKKRSVGLGGVADIEVEKVDYDWSMIKDGKAQRYLPDPDGMRICRLRPPYWNIYNAVACCDVGDDYV